jgi:hypothetical protein
LRKVTLLIAAAVTAGLVFATGAVSPGDRNAQAAPEDDIEATVQALADAWNEADIDAFMSFWTPEGLAYQFAFEDQDPAEFIAGDREYLGPIIEVTVQDVFVTSGNATATVDLHFENGFKLYEEWKFYFLDGGWKIGPGEPALRPIPEGVPAVPLGLQEYAFVYNKSAVEAADGNFAFQAVNTGEELHEVVIVSIEGNGSLLELIEAADSEAEGLPGGLELAEFGGFVAPGDAANVVLPEPLSPGRYGLVCFLPAPDGTPHVLLGMWSEFTVGGGLAVTPPSAGDGGLLNGGTPTMTRLLLGVTLLMVVGAPAAVVKGRRAPGP